ncbi:MAG: hypothetical protein PHP45_01550 [Elusimicrobiales bacterium]|nr:hypothetical protein [Elusimicrobiales bacterium]
MPGTKYARPLVRKHYGIAAALAACLLPAAVFAQGGYYPSPSGSLYRYYATQLQVGGANAALVGISSASVGGATTVDNSTYTGTIFGSNRTLSLRPEGNIIFTANQTGAAAVSASGSVTGGVESNGQYKSAVVPVDYSEGGQVYLSNLCTWQISDKCQGTIIAAAQTDGGAHIAYGPCMNMGSAKLFLCCKFTTLPVTSDPISSGPGVNMQTRIVYCESGSVIQGRKYHCTGGVPEGDTAWAASTNTCGVCTASPPEFRKSPCPEDKDAPPNSTFSGDITEMRTYTCPGNVAGAWKTIANTCLTRTCKVPATETRSQPCPTFPIQYSPGVQTQQRDWSCVDNIPVAGEWRTVSGACTIACLGSGQFISTRQPFSSDDKRAWELAGTPLPPGACAGSSCTTTWTSLGNAATGNVTCNQWGRCCCSGKVQTWGHWSFWGCV